MNDITNSTTRSDTTETQAFGGNFGAYTIGISVGGLVAIVLMAYISYFFKRAMIDAASHQDPSILTNTNNQDGLDENALSLFPTFTYVVPLDACKSDSTASSCCICLVDYKENDLLRLLPDCGHVFHLKCVDPWLIIHATCPICRKSPLPGKPLAPPAVRIDVME